MPEKSFATGMTALLLCLHVNVRSAETLVVSAKGYCSSTRHERRVEALRKLGATVEYHKYQNVGHGFGLGTGTSAGLDLQSHPVLGDGTGVPPGD
jgi:hypothetical protein